MDISPDKQNIDKIFSSTTYHIDFYQRQYKWTKEPVVRLLADVFYRFDEEYSKHKHSSLDLDKVVSKYAWYYLNTYVTNKVDGKLYVVDGQQRLTTLTLILICLYHLTKEQDSKLASWLSTKILGLSGFQEQYWMNHEAHLGTIAALYAGQRPYEDIDTSSGITARNMVLNYQEIEKVLRLSLATKHRLESFTFYFLHRLVLINLNVEQTDVPMVFEVINDRGVRLKPYEILKGKLLGQIPKDELDALGLNELWECQVESINGFWEDAIDDFFFYFLRGKLANSITDARKYEEDSYHRVLFTEETNRYLQLDHNPVAVKNFLAHDFRYFTNLFAQTIAFEGDEDLEPWVYYNGLNEMYTQRLLILSACRRDDPEEGVKIREVSYHVDRMFCLLQLQRSYDSNDFAQAIYRISGQLREKPAADIRAVFEQELKFLLAQPRGGSLGESVFNYGLFKDTGIELNRRFKRYFFARIDKFIADNTNVNMKHDFHELVTKTGPVNGFHIEHILAVNPANQRLFDNDEEVFNRERNRLGGLLLLKGKDNISSSNESYPKKLKSYANTLYWNETLREDAYKSKKDFHDLINTHSLQFRPMATFGPEELEERHKLLFDIASIIWE